MTYRGVEAGARVAFEEAAGMLQRMPGTQVDDNANEIQRTTEGMGLCVDARSALRAEAPAPEVPPDPAGGRPRCSASGSCSTCSRAGRRRRPP